MSKLRTALPAVELRGSRVTLRPCRLDFAPLLHAAALESVATLSPWMEWCHADYKEEEATDWLQTCEAAWNSGEAYEFAIFDAAGDYVGGAGLNQFNRLHNFANLGYWVRQSRQRQGRAVDAVQLLAAFGMDTLRLTRIEIVVAVGNVASRRVAEKAGALLEGIARNRLLLRDTPIAAAVYSLVERVAD